MLEFFTLERNKMADHHFNISTLVTTSSTGLEFTLPVVLVVLRKLILPMEMLELMLPLM
jgi:hypothetical protein